MGLGFYFMYQAWQTCNVNPMFLGEPLQEYYNYNFTNYFIDKVVGLVPLTSIPGGSLSFGVFIWWFSRIGDPGNLKGIAGA